MNHNIDEILKQGESQTTEFKKSLSLRKKAFESLCGMVNSDYAKGLVIFGISPTNDIIGIEPGNLDSLQISLTQHIGQKFEPPLICSIEVISIQDKFLIIISAKRLPQVPYHEYDSRAFIREGTLTRKLVLTEKINLQKIRNREQHNGPWECDRCGTIVNMLSSIVVTDCGIHKSFKCHCGGEFWPLIESNKAT